MAGISKKSLYINRVDVGAANRLASEALNFASSATCGFSDPNSYNFDHYGRNATVHSLPFGGNGAYASPCAALTQQGVQQRIAVENEVERQFIDFSTTPGLQYPYDTMGSGRTMIEQRGGGSPGCTYGAPGGWGQQYDMKTRGQQCAQECARMQGGMYSSPPHYMESLAKPPKERLNLHYAFANRYNG